MGSCDSSGRSELYVLYWSSTWTIEWWGALVVSKKLWSEVEITWRQREHNITINSSWSSSTSYGISTSSIDRSLDISGLEILTMSETISWSNEVQTLQKPWLENLGCLLASSWFDGSYKEVDEKQECSPSTFLKQVDKNSSGFSTKDFSSPLSNHRLTSGVFYEWLDVDAFVDAFIEGKSKITE